MKNTVTLILIIFIVACSGTKHTFNELHQKEAQSPVPKDSVAETSPKLQDEENSISNNNPEKQQAIQKDSTNFNRALVKNVIPTHELWNALLEKHVSSNGTVNYKLFKTDHEKLLDYINVLNLSYTNDKLESFTKEEKLAFWINAYNALTIDLILRHYPVKSIKDIKNPWEQRLWKFGATWYNLETIEHDILRKMNEPRIHFAIVCASVSCPKLQNEAFIASKLESQLTHATRVFLADANRNDITENSLKLSKIFQWFSKDFKQYGSLIDFINVYSDIEIASNARITYKDYNWNLNE